MSIKNRKIKKVLLTNMIMRGNMIAESGNKGAKTVTDMEYIDQTIKRLVEELKQRNCLSQDFTFLTKAEREALLNKAIDDFLKNR